MQAEQQNYGVAEGPETRIETRDERTWSVLSHLSIFLNLVTGFLGPVASLIVWFFYRERSQKVSLPGASINDLPGSLARYTGRRMGRDVRPDGDPDRLPARAGHGARLDLPLCTQRLRGIQGEPGRRLPVPGRRGPDREPLEEPAKENGSGLPAGAFCFPLKCIGRTERGGSLLKYPLELGFKIPTIGPRVRIKDATGRLVSYVRKKKWAGSSSTLPT